MTAACTRENPFRRLDVVPGYGTGFAFHWTMAEDFSEAPPWTFKVQVSQAPTSGWEDLSPKLQNSFFWSSDKDETASLLTNKRDVLWFRVTLSTGDGRSYASLPMQPYGDLPKREFLLGRDIMRREVLHCRGMAGTLNAVLCRNTHGPRCAKCVDPVSGTRRDSHCSVCMGTGFDPPYHGPYRMWMSFSADQQHSVAVESDGTTEQKMFQVRAIGSLLLYKDDIVVDLASDKRYKVNQFSVVVEIRRVPLVQTLVVSELALSDAAYDIVLPPGLRGLA